MEYSANEQFRAFPRSMRSTLHARILADIESPFRDGPDDSWTGRGFAIALGDFAVPISHCSLSDLLDCMGLKGTGRVEFVATFVRWMTVLNPASVDENAR